MSGRVIRLFRTAAILAAGFAGSALFAQSAAPQPQACNSCVVLLGTRGGPVIDSARSEPANLLVVDGVPYEIDAGEGAARQIAAAGYALPSIHDVFITHHHLDHTAGLEPLMSHLWITKALGGQDLQPLEIYGPPSTRFLVDAALRYLSVSERIFRAGLPNLARSRTMFTAHDSTPGLVFQDSRVKVTAATNSHFGHPSSSEGKRDLSFAYRFDTPRASIVFTGDTGPSEAVNELAKDADILVSEVFVAREAVPARTAARGLAEHMSQEHLSPAEVGKLAQNAHVKKVVLTHIVGTGPDLEQRLIAGVQQYYSGPVIVGHDLMKIAF